MGEVKAIGFNGTEFQTLGRGLLAIILSLLIIPAAWGSLCQDRRRPIDVGL